MSNFNDCRDITQALTSAQNPLAQGISILNPDRRDPDFDQIPLQIQLGIYHIDQWYEHRLYVQPDSIRGKEKAGFDVSEFGFILQDWKDPSILPFSPAVLQGQRVRILNENATEIYAKGQVDKIRRIPFYQAPSNRDLVYYQVSCVNEMDLFRRAGIFEIQRNTTECGMLADLTGRYCPELDISGINVALGQTIDQRTLDGLYLFQVYQEVLRRNPNLAFYLDISQEPTRVVVDTRDSVEAAIGITLTDANLYQFCRPGDFQIDTTGRQYRNQVRLRYQRLYNAGTMDVDADSSIVYGTDTRWFGNVAIGDTLRRVGSESRYTIDDNLSTADESVEELRLSYAYKEATETGAEYEIISQETEIIVNDPAEIERLAQLNGESGEIAGVREVILTESEPLTDDEAYLYADTALSLNSWDGFWQTNSRLVPFPHPRAGQTLHCVMPLRGVQDHVPVQEVDWAIRPGWCQPRFGRISPKVELRLSFRDRAGLTESLFLQLLLSGRRARIRDQSKLRVSKTVSERHVTGICARATAGEAADSEYTAGLDAAGYLVDPVTPFLTRYPRTVADGQLPMDPLAIDDPSTLWFPT